MSQHHHDEVALATAQEIEDIFAMGHVGGRAQRLACVQIAIIGAIERCTGTGEHQGRAVKPAPVLASPPESPSAVASHGCDVGAAPAGSAERPPQPVHETPEPAPFPSVQNEAEGIQGEDQPAQKGEALVPPPSARAAAAEVGKADPRNSSCEPAAVAGPGSQTDDPKPYVTKREQALVLLSTTELTFAEIAEALDSTEASIRSTIRIAERAGDPRASVRRVAPPRPSTRSKAQPAPAPVAPAPKPKSNRVVVLDESLLRVIGFRGSFTTDRKIFDTIARLNDGDMHTIESLTKAGGWSSPPMFQTKLGLLGEKLDDIGIKLTHIRGQGCKIERKLS